MQNNNFPIRILITGAHSFVGTNFRHLSGHKLIDEISLIDKKPEEINFSGYNVVIHLVAIVHQSTRIEEKEYFVVNRDLCIKVAEIAKKAGVGQFIFMSSVKVYGKYKPGYGPWNENSKCFPEDSYGKSKYEAEILLQKLETPGFVVSIIRTPLIYGEGVKANMNGILRLIDNIPLLPFKQIENKRFFTSTENLTAFIDRIIQKRISGVFIAMDEKALSTTELVNLISKYLGKRIFLFKIPKLFIRLGMVMIPRIFDRLYGSFEMDNSITLKMLEFRPPFTTEQGIEKMVNAYRHSKVRDNLG